MWGPSIVGFDEYHYKYANGREADMCTISFSPRSEALTLYVMPSISGYKGLLKKLGKARSSGCCLHIKKIEDVDLGVLREILEKSYNEVKKKYKP
jgi:hypothetical protein